MRLIVSGAIREKYPDLRFGFVVAKNVNNVTYQEGLEEFVSETFNKFARKFDEPRDLEEYKNIMAWREIYRSFGINPKKKKPTAEAVLARAIRSNYVPRISPAVDAYLCAETAHYLPIGGYDMDKISGDIVLRYSSGGEEFFGVGAEAVDATNEGEIVYSDNNRVLTRCWNYRDSDFTKIDDKTTTLALFVEAPLATITDDEIKETIKQVSDNLQKYCGAQCTETFMSSQENEVTIL